ncbi:PspC domain-containing protein [Jatrophihabitans sp. GAS493]|uniref:PspC domain-containing protein n=1 Tax=Jatrophihabitans sp. GAS493 TaxID=1907575 RepID=UPI0012FD0F9E|nr:PspC domain-containing protein [Jatrophihabitans sp. GAS493]
MTAMTSETASPPPPPPSRLLRRSAGNRVVAGVSGGLGEYFGIDPVLFRILFATTAFFGGGGIIAYLVAWLAIPEAGSTKTGMDRIVTELRNRRIPVWVVVTAIVIAAWIGLFSWWAPWGFGPLLVAGFILFVAFRRKGVANRTPIAATDGTAALGTAPDGTAPVNLTKPLTPLTPSDQGQSDPTADLTTETRAWFAESRAASRRRRHRAAPVRWATLGLLVVAMVVLYISDRVNGIILPAYFWVAGAILLGGLIVGAILRRTPWSLLILVPLALLGLIAFGGTRASLHDGIGVYAWAPTSYSELEGDYRLAFGKTTLDLTELPPSTVDRHVEITMAAGQSEIIVGSTANIRVNADVHFGNIILTGPGADSPRAGFGFETTSKGGAAIATVEHSGVNVHRTIQPPAAATGGVITVDVQLEEGNITVRT